nr:MAG TPA: tail protein [Bacteriophage sp.]
MATDNETKTLLEYLPPFLREYYEFKQLCKSGDIEVSSIDKAVDWNFDSAFISDCDATVLSKYEQLLGIIPTSSQSIENRRNKVLLQWNTVASMTLPQFISKLQEYCGKDNFTVDNSREQFYQLVIWLNIHKVDIPLIKDFIDTWLPMNVNYTLNGKTEIEESLKIGFLTKIEERNQISVEEYNDDTIVYCADDENNIILDDDGNILILDE